MTFRPSIVVAVILGLALVGGALVLVENKPDDKSANTTYTSDTAPLRTFIAVADADKNNIPDWQDGLSIPTINLDELDANATPTQTSEVAIELAQTSLSSSTIGTLDIRDRVIDINNDTPFTRADIIVSGNDDVLTQKIYGNAVATITFTYAPPAGTRNELEILNSAFISDNGKEVIKELDPIITSYENMINAMENTPVPPSLVVEHLSLLNVYQAILSDLKAFRHVFSDALPAMTRFSRYQADVYALYTAISNLYLKLDANGIQWTEADMASKLIKVESNE